MSHTLGAFNYIEFRLYSCLIVLVVVFLHSVLLKNINIIEKSEVLKRYNWACKQNCESLSRSCLFCNSLLLLENRREAFYGWTFFLTKIHSEIDRHQLRLKQNSILRRLHKKFVMKEMKKKTACMIINEIRGTHLS